MLAAEAFPAIEELRLSCIDYINENQPTTLDYIDRKRELRIIGFRPSRIAPNRQRVQASRIIKDLRDALDQATFQASKRLNPAGKNSTYFPFCRDPDDFKTLFDPKKGRSRDIPERLRPFLLGLEPYPTLAGRTGGNDLLRALGYVAGPNKHQTTLRVAPDLPGFMIQELMNRGLGAMESGFMKHGSDLEIVRASIGANIVWKFTVSFYLAFEAPSQLANGPAAAVLGDLARIVQRVVLGIEAETNRLLG